LLENLYNKRNFTKHTPLNRTHEKVEQIMEASPIPKARKPRVKRTPKAKVDTLEPIVETGGDIEHHEDEGEIVGGKFNLGKSLKKVGKSVANGVKKVGSIAASPLIGATAGVVGKYAGEQLVNGLKSMGTNALAAALEIGETALMAAGMNKQKKTRSLSQKEKNRHQLVKQLMAKHNISLPEASKMIKARNLKY
jgi:xanthosine utilization system XapX-like protein